MRADRSAGLLCCSSCGGKTISTRPAMAHRAPLRRSLIGRRHRPRGRKCGRSPTRTEAAAHPCGPAHPSPRPARLHFRRPPRGVRMRRFNRRRLGRALRHRRARPNGSDPVKTVGNGRSDFLRLRPGHSRQRFRSPSVNERRRTPGTPGTPWQVVGSAPPAKTSDALRGSPPPLKLTYHSWTNI